MRMNKRDSIKSKRVKILNELQKKDVLTRKLLGESRNLKDSLNKERIEKGVENLEKIKINISQNSGDMYAKLKEEEDRTKAKSNLTLI
jgi:hypothetical protein